MQVFGGFVRQSTVAACMDKQKRWSLERITLVLLDALNLFGRQVSFAKSPEPVGKARGEEDLGELLHPLGHTGALVPILVKGEHCKFVSVPRCELFGRQFEVVEAPKVVRFLLRMDRPQFVGGHPRPPELASACRTDKWRSRRYSSK